MIQAHYVEIRSRRGPHNIAPTTVIQEVHVKNGKGTRTTRVLRGNRVISNVSESLRTSQKTKKARRTQKRR